jgi:hypothetical protein
LAPAGRGRVKPLAIDLGCGLGGWTRGLMAAGYDCIGFDIERHEYDGERYPAQLVLQDILTLHGSQFCDVDLIVASPPCQFFSYTAMPWSRAKALAAEVRASPERLEKELALFKACFRLQQEASEAAGRHIPVVVENVRGAQPWVGRAQFNFGSYYLWGDVPALMPSPKHSRRSDNPADDGIKVPGPRFQNIVGAEGWRNDCYDGRKAAGFRFDGSGRSFQTEQVARTEGRKADGRGVGRDCEHPFGWQAPDTSSASPRRKAASARIAMIPLALSTWIGRCYYPRELARRAEWSKSSVVADAVR